ncbi:hypothetical protein [Teredinibacter waterburyi]|uniref:hypothetical protein n=1 Tax=Teredinibacter waterburyi TaxID=1500538 RepID=UPI00165FEB2E|nr:hypothetical protein [Teredinibacter waterburyi]
MQEKPRLTAKSQSCNATNNASTPIHETNSVVASSGGTNRAGAQFSITAERLDGDIRLDSSNPLQQRVRDQQHLFHSCVINGEPHIVHARNLPEQDPTSFSTLTAYAKQQGIRLLAERRSEITRIAADRRKSWLPILLLTISMNAEPTLADADKHDAETHISAQHGWSKQLDLIDTLGPIESANHQDQKADALWFERAASATDKAKISTSAKKARAISNRLLKNLKKHFRQAPEDPEDIRDSVQELARYYSRFPKVVALLDSLEDAPWELHYQASTFKTEVTGTRLKVASAKIFFDPNTGAKLKFHDRCDEKIQHCVASPADALLHELLHASDMLLNSEAFIASGGMGALIYPFEHEHKTIRRENALYHSMTAIDQQPRPLRNDHTGRYIMVACSTCTS